MKTEQIVKSPRDGVVQRVSVEEGDRVDKGMRLVVLVPEVGEGSEGIRLRNL
jgi:biotin carboxyl carrier protein